MIPAWLNRGPPEKPPALPLENWSVTGDRFHRERWWAMQIYARRKRHQQIDLACIAEIEAQLPGDRP